MFEVLIRGRPYSAHAVFGPFLIPLSPVCKMTPLLLNRAVYCATWMHLRNPLPPRCVCTIWRARYSFFVMAENHGVTLRGWPVEDLLTRRQWWRKPPRLARYSAFSIPFIISTCFKLRDSGSPYCISRLFLSTFWKKLKEKKLKTQGKNSITQQKTQWFDKIYREKREIKIFLLAKIPFTRNP